jgi:hypothetical protein
MYVQPLDGSLTPNLTAPAAGAGSEGTLFPGAAPAAGDAISRFAPPWSNDGTSGAAYGDGYGSSGSLQGLFGPLMGVLQQLMQMMQSLMGYGCGPSLGSGGCSPYGGSNEKYFQNASGSSDGDPHLSFNGVRWNDMASQPDLLNSNSFAGGFRIGTQVTPPNGKGVTWNQSATVSMNNGATTVSMSDNGQASIESYGQQISIARGQTVQLGGGESVTCEQNGSLRVVAQNGSGGSIETTLSPQGKGVNVDVTAHDVDLGGALVDGSGSGRISGGGPGLSGGPGFGPTPLPIIPPPPQPLSGPTPF